MQNMFFFASPDASALMLKPHESYNFYHDLPV